MTREARAYKAALDESMARFRERAAGPLGPYSGEGLLVDLTEALVTSMGARGALSDRIRHEPQSFPKTQNLLNAYAAEKAYCRDLAEGIAELRTYLAEHDQVLEEHDPGASDLYAWH